MDSCLSQRVLVLNRLWQAVNIVGARRAFGLLFQDHAKVIHSSKEDFRVFEPGEWISFSIDNPPADERWCVHTIRYKIRIPKILLLKHYDRLPLKEMKFTRENLFGRDNYTCQYCGKSYTPRELNLDHVIPRERGGKTTWENIVTSCLRCNTRKANRFPHEARMHLKRRPARPKLRPFVSSIAGPDCEKSWINFLHVARH